MGFAVQIWKMVVSRHDETELCRNAVPLLCQLWNTGALPLESDGLCVKQYAHCHLMMSTDAQIEDGCLLGHSAM
jgi:hypothetical protein